MILSQHDIRKAVEERRIVFDPPLECDQFKEASVDLRLGFSFTLLKENLPGVKVSVADGIKTIKDAELYRARDLEKGMS